MRNWREWLSNLRDRVAYVRASQYRLWYVLMSLAIAVSIVVFAVAFLATRAPTDFPISRPVVIEEGMSAAAVAEQFAEERVVQFADLLYITLVLFHDPSEIKAGAYVFSEPLDLFAIARQITDEGPPADYVSLTFFEGTTAAHYAHTAGKYLEDFDVEHFANKGRSYEGFLFPDTYFVPRSFSADDLISLLFRTYHEQVTPIMETNTTPYTEYEILTIASLLEREGDEPENMRMIAGIMENRLALDMPLQLDASMEYVLDKPLNELTPADLRRESPYNTYLNAGLPPTPIGNPGIAAIEAAIDPIPSDYLFYITGNDGNFYYAETYQEHLQNIDRYLR